MPLPSSEIPPSSCTPRWQVWGCLILMLVGLYLIVGPKVNLSKWRVTPDGNTALAEALAWRNGTLALSNDFQEDVHFNGSHYNVVGLAFVILSYVGTSLSDWLATYSGWQDSPHEALHPVIFVMMVALPLPFLGYWAFRTVGKSPPWAAVLTVYLIAGTSLRPVLTYAGEGSIYKINHVLAVSGLLLIAGDLLGRRRIWPAVFGLALAAWSRQMTCLYALPLLGLAWERRAQTASGSQTGPTVHGEPLQPVAAMPPPHSRRIPGRFFLALAGLVVIGGVPVTLNALKFGNPFDTGYLRMYDERLDKIGIDASRQFYGPDYLLRHAKAMFWAYPEWDIRGGQLYPVTDDIEGGSIWFTSPLLLAIVPTVIHWWQDRRARALMLASFLVMIAVMGYHTTGAQRAGFYRYSLDFIPIWLVVIAPYITTRRYIPFTLACLAYSTLYFNIIPP
ncbi:MAG TPA: hypothetical protein VMV94_18180 [Phycisphaerae bacterium]|nr:hypothetical protein [Phycisphaerae bacterium]